ncbi:MAG TPA: glycoside hydrolase family 16 protein [Capsulimonadaceae bacterium]|jgi:beta-glucanase (GH16 family)
MNRPTQRGLFAAAGATLLLAMPATSFADVLPTSAKPAAVTAPAGPVKPVVDVAAPGVSAQFASSQGSGGQASAADSTDPAAPGVVITIQPGPAGYPGIALTPKPGPTWDLSAFGHIIVNVTNTGTVPTSISMRVDNAPNGDANPWNTESTYLKPGETGNINVIFGHQYGHKPGYALKPATIGQLLFFADKANAVKTFRINSIMAGGPAGEKPPIDPNSLRTVPVKGVIIGAGVKLDLEKQAPTTGGTATLVGEGLQVAFTGSPSWTAIKPPLGKWDLRAATQVRVHVKNTGTTPISPRVQASGGASTDVATTPAPLAPGASAEIVTQFAPAAHWVGVPNSGDRTSWDGVPGTGTKFTSDACDSIKVSSLTPGTLLIDSVIADAPAAVLPEWVGKRPPVDGDWVMTFNDTFAGKSIETTRWNTTGHNYWDRKTHWTKDNLLLTGKGGVTLRFEKKRGPHNDDPKWMQEMTSPKVSETDYACGFLDTFGKWAQRYGYYEARVKLPTAPGLWPTFWMMPDRGPAAGEEWKRTDTGNGAMELDIMEHLTRWGNHRYNIAMHWDGYGKNHHQTGTTFNYTQHDKDGYMTVGMLWLPGQLKYYCNGKEMVSWDDPRISTVAAYFIIEMTTGGWDNDAVDDSKLPADYTIDYVRAWQRKDLASPADSPANVGK